MTTYGLLIDYEYCTNCGSCVVSCKEEHDYPVGKSGITLLADGPWKMDDNDNWNWNTFPMPTDLCDLCAERTGKGKEPICAHHCLSGIIYYGTVEELSKKLEDKPKQLLIVPQYKPREARGEFVHKENKTDGHHAAHVEVDGTGEAAFGAHRHDAKVGEFEVEEDL
ncbi:oxidoreductase [Raoultibacter massiliensis]|uniref:oxidoreductase n=1 Tax=Raoultibacter massiliensis TaxID=1852371 RepID=UPI000C830C84|nr:oxidoreductase [Raoultibacter massiliensis]